MGQITLRQLNADADDDIAQVGQAGASGVKDDRTPLLPGTVLNDRFEIGGQIGAGGFGITYQAIDRQNDEKVAIKEFYPPFCAVRTEEQTIAPSDGGRLDFDKYIAEFRHEALALSGFHHENIVKVISRFDGNGTAYFAMEFVEGEGLNDVCKTPLTTEETMLLAEKLITAVKLMHDQELIHRDIKPGNIRLARIDEPAETLLPDVSVETRIRFGRPVLLDFGAARGMTETERTMTGIGSHFYGAPEQMVSRGRQSTRTDIYGLGATLYHCLAGEPPQASPERKVQDLLVPARQRFSATAPENFLRAIDRALRLVPDERPRDVRLFRSELFADLSIAEWTLPGDRAHFREPGSGPYTGTDPNTGTDPSTTRTSTKPALRNRMSLGLIAVTALLTAGAGTFFFLSPPQPVFVSVPGPAQSAPMGDLVRAQMDLICARLTLAETAQSDIIANRPTLAEAEANDMVDFARATRAFINTREAEIETSLETARLAYRELVGFAQSDPEEFETISRTMAASRRQSGQPRVALWIDDLSDMALSNVGETAVDDEEFVRFWLRELSI